jgi:translation initiation factor IF-2
MLVVVLALAACGGGSSTNASSTTGAGAGAQRPGGGFLAAVQDPKVQACLKKAGVTLPSGGGPGRPGGPAGAGTRTAPPPQTGTTARPPAGVNGGPRGNPGQFAKLRTALAKCGVTLPNRGPGGPGGPGGGAPAPTTTS